MAGLERLARSLDSEGRAKQALLLFEHLAAIRPRDEAILLALVKLLGAQGRTLQAIEKLAELKTVSTDADVLLGEIKTQMTPAIERFNAHLAAGELGQAEHYASALASLAPRNVALMDAVFSCNLALGRKEKATAYAAALLALNSSHAGARALLSGNSEAATRPEIESEQEPAQAVVSEVHPLLRLRDAHDAISAILCQPLTAQGIAQIEKHLQASRELVIDVPAGSEWEGWVKHYRLALEAIDIAAVQRPTPKQTTDAGMKLMSSSGVALKWQDLQAKAARLRAKTMFFAAADRAYIDLYAKWYIKSVLKHADVPCLIVLHVIGGAKELPEVAKSIGIKDKRLIYSGDLFDAAAVTTQCYDTPPKGRIVKPVAHLQSVRFTRLNMFLQKLKLPVFVSDIDLLLQRGMKDLLERSSGADIVLNENSLSANAGSRLTANLLLLNPTENAGRFLRFLKSYLEDFLGRGEVTRWIDQFGLMLARHHLLKHGKTPRIEYFDTAKDINNVMYPSYQENPFRFLSLYHGFDMASLEANLNLATEQPKRRTAKRAVKRPAPHAPRRRQPTAAKSRRAPVAKTRQTKAAAKTRSKR
jgi:tetratricopeptide (TPR) repeat protein